MRQFKVVLLGIGALALSFGTAGAGLNPANAGLGILNNMSSICVACHTVAPGGDTHQGTHFVYDTADSARSTNSGGGFGTYNFGGAPRTAGQYFKTTQWTGMTGSAGYSKYGRITDNASISRSTDNATYGAAVNSTTVAEYQAAEIICESCHNVVRNVVGGNNLLAPMAAMTATPFTQTQGVAGTAPYYSQSAAEEAPLCVGCHGFMYTEVPATQPDPGTYAADARNTGDLVAARRGNNNAHYVAGTKMRQNHHVGTGDQIGLLSAQAGILWRDVLTIPATGIAAVIGATNGATRGQMPQRVAWDADGGKLLHATNLNCVMCHSAAHNGLNGAAASILRDTTAGGIALGARTAATSGERTTRIGEGTRSWMSDYSDVAFCNDCHRLKP